MTVQVPSSQPEVDVEHMREDEVEIVMDGDGDVMETPSRPPPSQAPVGKEGVIAAKNFEMTTSDDEYGFDAEMLDAMGEVVVPPAPAAPAPPASQKRARQESPVKDDHPIGSSAMKRARRESPAKDNDPAPHSSALKCARLPSNLVETQLGMSPCHANTQRTMSSGRQRTMSSESNISIPSASREKTSKLFDKVKTLKAQGLPMNYPPPPTSSQYEPGYQDGEGVYHPPESQFGGPSRAFRELQAAQCRSSGASARDVDGGRTTHGNDGSRASVPDLEPHPSIERDEEKRDKVDELGRDAEDVAWENNALEQQARREMEEREERENQKIREREERESEREANRKAGRIDPAWLYENQ